MDLLDIKIKMREKERIDNTAKISHFFTPNIGMDEMENIKMAKIPTRL